ncbi:MAG: valine--tRNA ligase, partial [Candidatus Krumholzibacteria bacterium]|nr:valine--tRNA ligase [Candidatus Krumholzibacteria bacterium]
MLDKVYTPGDIERRWSAAWSEQDAFTADARSPAPPFCIILPPPNVTGMLTVGHALGTTVQDILCRWKRLCGHEVLWLSGTDHAGIATQNVVERALLDRGIARTELGRERFLEECWTWKEKYHGRIVEQLERLGASLDWTRETFTLDPGVSRAVREVFVRLYEKRLIYRGTYIVNWCPRCGTAISDEEVEFREQDSRLWYIAYPLASGQGEIVVGTTRPETMLGDVAVAMSPDDPRASELEGVLVQLPLAGREIPIVLDEAVDPQFGTGFLKVTPAHDSTDYQIGMRHGLEPLIVIDAAGRMNDRAGRFAGLDLAAARSAVLDELEREGLLRKIEDYRHAVGHHDRCGGVVEPYVSKQWFLRMEELAAPAVAAVRGGEVTFMPQRWENIYLAWMENIRDWCISRQLWWGHRIPVWYCDGCGAEIVSREDPRSCGSCGGAALRQDPDVLDTWFSSWLWSFSPMGWPERTDDLEKFHPTDVLVTGGDIIFFWVARMIMAALEFMGEVPFSDVYITGIVRDAKGRKMSKSLGNSPDMIDIIERGGADAFRFALMMLSPPGQDLLFDETKVDVGRHFANKIWNAARFVLGRPDEEAVQPGADDDAAGSHCIAVLCADLFGERPAGARFGWEDGWIASRLAARAAEYASALDSYRFDEASRIIYDFFWHEYCDWYLELSKPAVREGGARGLGARAASRAVLGMSMVLIHPIMPFISEEIWSMLAPGAGLLARFRLPAMPDGIRRPELDEDVGRM